MIKDYEYVQIITKMEFSGIEIYVTYFYCSSVLLKQ